MYATLYEALASVTEGASLEETPRTRVMSFGDGYKQTTPDGLTPVARKLTLQWTGLDTATASSLIALLRAHLAAPVSFAAPREPGPRLWLPMNWRRSSPYPGADDVTATFEERFPADLDPQTPASWDDFGSFWDFGASAWRS